MRETEPGNGLDPKEANQAAWDARAGAYHKSQGDVSVQAVGPLLDAAGILAGDANFGQWVLDVGTGPGYGAGEAARRGARAVGLDFAPGMVALAARNFPEAGFLQGDGENLPFADGGFDALISCFAMPQMPRPDRAIAEAHRVLAPGGRYGIALRAGDDRDRNRIMVYDAVGAHGDLDAIEPAADFGLRDPARYEALLAQAGFKEFGISEVTMAWRPRTDAELLNAFHTGSRSSRLLARQTSEAKERIHRAILDAATAFKTPEGYEIPRLALILSATKS